jgi:pyruvate dehydrogenase E1 component alpha subunit
VKRKSKKETTVSKKEPQSVLREDCFRVLNEDNSTDPKKDPKLAKDLLLKMYRNMALTRAFDERGMMLQRQGRIGFYVPSFGQEAIQTGTAAALTLKDWVFPSYREPGIFIYRGASLYQMLGNLWGNAADVCKGRQMPVHYSFADLRLFSVSSPIATQVIQAVGASMASKIRKEKDIAITYFGDGATSENDFHTGLTFAGAYKAPTVFICTNNQYAISVPLYKQTGCQRLADKAVGYGMPGVAVDGNDVLAVYTVTAEAVARARRGEGPTLIECLTLRMGPHSSSDDPTRYRDEKLYEAWKKRDPIARFRQYLESKKYWDSAQEQALQEVLKQQISEAIEKAEAQPSPVIDELFDDVFAERTPQLEAQRKQLLAEGELRGKFENTSVAFPL